PLAQHDLLAFGMLQIDEVFFGAPESDVEADDVRPERQAGGEVGDMQLGDHVGPAGFRRSVPFGGHSDIFRRWYGNRSIMPFPERWTSTGATAAASGAAWRRHDDEQQIG